MCRWLVWCGPDPIPLETLLFWPTNSLIHQSFNGGFHPECPGKNNMTLNADGFGVGWYTPCARAAIFRSTTAAWNNRNLRELSRTIESKCIFAHVRAASETSVISEQNCHPFRFGRLLFQHNGHIEQFHRIKRRLFSVLRDDVYEWCEGTTDSEACFALLLSLIDPSELAHGGPIEPKLLQEAMLGTIAAVRHFLADAGIMTGYSTFNFALTDGQTVVVTRYCDKAPTIPAPSLYYAFAEPAALRQHLRGCPAGRLAPGHGATAMKPLTSASAGGCGGARQGASDVRQPSTKLGNRAAFICASEPLTTDIANWHLIHENSMLTYEAGTGLRGAGSGNVSTSSSTTRLPSGPSHDSLTEPLALLDVGLSPKATRTLELAALAARTISGFADGRAGSVGTHPLDGCPKGHSSGSVGASSEAGADEEEEGWMAALHALPLATPLCKHAVARALRKLKCAAAHGEAGEGERTSSVTAAADVAARPTQWTVAGGNAATGAQAAAEEAAEAIGEAMGVAMAQAEVAARSMADARAQAQASLGEVASHRAPASAPPPTPSSLAATPRAEGVSSPALRHFRLDAPAGAPKPGDDAGALTGASAASRAAGCRRSPLGLRHHAADGSADATGNAHGEEQGQSRSAGSTCELVTKLPLPVSMGASSGGAARLPLRPPASQTGARTSDRLQYLDDTPPHAGGGPPDVGPLEGTTSSGAATASATSGHVAAAGDTCTHTVDGYSSDMDDERVSVFPLHEGRLESFLASATGAATPKWRQQSVLKLLCNGAPVASLSSPRSVAAAAAGKPRSNPIRDMSLDGRRDG